MQPKAECGWLVQPAELEATHALAVAAADPARAPRSKIRLKFDRFDLEDPTPGTSECPFNGVDVYDGGKPELGGKLVASLCGNQIPAPIYSSGNLPMYVRFRSDVSNENAERSGFRASYTTLKFDPSLFCSDLMETVDVDALIANQQGRPSPTTLSSGVSDSFQLKKFTGPTPALKCSWLLSTPSKRPGLRIALKLLRLGADCSKENLKVYVPNAGDQPASASVDRSGAASGQDWGWKLEKQFCGDGTDPDSLSFGLPSVDLAVSTVGKVMVQLNTQDAVQPRGVEFHVLPSNNGSRHRVLFGATQALVLAAVVWLSAPLGKRSDLL